MNAMKPSDAEFVDQFEHLLQQIEQIVRQYPPEMRELLRDEARVSLRLQLQERWEHYQQDLQRKARWS